MSRLGAVLDWLAIICGPAVIFLIIFGEIGHLAMKWLALMGTIARMADAMKDRAAARTTPTSRLLE